MPRPIIEVQGLSKRYRLGQLGARTLREDVERFWRRLRGSGPVSASTSMPAAGTGSGDQDFWALRDVSFEVQPGEVLGIIGRNGAGKSTLLKILSRITRPTSGEAILRGRIASLLEVGTGFHPELTGRENIFLNGAILGMKKAEVAAKLDEIVAFAEVGPFIDTPVKRYSSGMYVRLAFAVAAHLEPEILIVDEVLAVGDAAFQQKCMGKMKEVSGRDGRTVLFVSHNMAAVAQLCSRALLLQDGGLLRQGPAGQVTRDYLEKQSEAIAEVAWQNEEQSPGDDRVRLLGLRLIQEDQTTTVVDINRPLQVEFRFRVLRQVQNLVSGVSFYDAQENCLFANCDWRECELKPGIYSKRASIAAHTFAEGRVRVLAQLIFHDPAVLSVVLPSILSFTAADSAGPDPVRGKYKGEWPGQLRLKLHWTDAQAADDAGLRQTCFNSSES